MTEFRAAAVGTAELPHRFVADTPPVLVGMSAAMDRLRAEVLRASAHNGALLVTGEPGSGKSLVARALHEQGPRGRQLCAVVACQAFPETLLEVELFGCGKGSVVGATCERRGVLEMADGGTVILENIEALSPRTQVLLERFLDSGHVHRVGTFGPGKPVSTRIIATSSLAPTAADASGRRHQQLWERLTRTAIHVPSLRERRADIPLLSQFFASGHETGHVGAVFSADAMHALSAYSWPGNVSQLRSVVERLVDGSAGQVLAHDLPVGIRPRQRGNRAAHGQRPTVGEDLFARVKTTGESFWSAVYPLFMKREITRGDLRDLIRRALDAARGNVDGLVRVLNMPGSDRPKFEKFLRKYGCEPPV